MQPKRDPTDTRFLPIAEGGTGRGFTRKDRTNHPRRWGVTGADREDMGLAPILSRRQQQTPEAARIRARAVLMLALERQEQALQGDSELTSGEISQAINALARIALPASEAGGPVTITVVRRAEATATVVEVEQPEDTTLAITAGSAEEGTEDAADD